MEMGDWGLTKAYPWDESDVGVAEDLVFVVVDND